MRCKEQIILYEEAIIHLQTSTSIDAKARALVKEGKIYIDAEGNFIEDIESIWKTKTEIESFIRECRLEIEFLSKQEPEELKISSIINGLEEFIYDLTTQHTIRKMKSFLKLSGILFETIPLVTIDTVLSENSFGFSFYLKENRDKSKNVDALLKRFFHVHDGNFSFEMSSIDLNEQNDYLQKTLKDTNLISDDLTRIGVFLDFYQCADLDFDFCRGLCWINCCNRFDNNIKGVKKAFLKLKVNLKDEHQTKIYCKLTEMVHCGDLLGVKRIISLKKHWIQASIIKNINNLREEECLPTIKPTFSS